VAYSVELVLLKKRQIAGGGVYLDCYHVTCEQTTPMMRVLWLWCTEWPLSKLQFGKDFGIRTRTATSRVLFTSENSNSPATEVYFAPVKQRQDDADNGW